MLVPGLLVPQPQSCPRLSAGRCGCARPPCCPEQGFERQRRDRNEAATAPAACGTVLSHRLALMLQSSISDPRSTALGLTPQCVVLLSMLGSTLTRSLQTPVCRGACAQGVKGHGAGCGQASQRGLGMEWVGAAHTCLFSWNPLHSPPVLGSGWGSGS